MKIISEKPYIPSAEEIKKAEQSMTEKQVREMKKPCIVSTKIATQVLKDGDLVEVDADNGVVRILERVE